jgi:hypothetical protein
MKKILLALFIALPFSGVFSQTFMHGVGVTVMGSSSNTFSNYVASGFTYSPRVNFIENENLSVSVGIPLTVAIAIGLGNDYYSTGGFYTDASSVGIVVNVPLVVNLNMGRGSTKENRQKFGYFFGGGLAFHHGDFIDDYSDDGTSTVNAFGPAANTGIRFGVGRKHKNIEVRFSYMKGLNESKPNIFGVAGLFNF